MKKLEEEGIGRPSTYAPTISTVQARGYVEKDGRQLKPTDVGFIVTDFLTAHFPKVVDYKFTVRMEDMLDEIEDGHEKWQDEVKEFYDPFSKLVEKKEETVSREDAGQNRELGIDPKTKKPVSVRIGRYGPFVQLGDREDEEKPKFAPVPKDMSMYDVDLETALELFKLPRTLGKTDEGEEIEANIGRYGPYVRVAKNFYSLKEDDPYTITHKRALEVIKEGEEKKKKALIAEFEDEDIRILVGPYGPYIKQGKKNYKIPKDKDPEKLKLADCKQIIADVDSGKTPRRGFRRKKKK